MAARKMTFSFPDELASAFVRRVPARNRSKFMAEALEAHLRMDDEALVRACIAANQDLAAKQLEEEWDAIQEDIEEPWVS